MTAESSRDHSLTRLLQHVRVCARAHVCVWERARERVCVCKGLCMLVSVYIPDEYHTFPQLFPPPPFSPSPPPSPSPLPSPPVCVTWLIYVCEHVRVRDTVCHSVCVCVCVCVWFVRFFGCVVVHCLKLHPNMVKLITSIHCNCLSCISVHRYKSLVIRVKFVFTTWGLSKAYAS